MDWRNYALGAFLLASLFTTDQLSPNGWRSGDTIRSPASEDIKSQLEKETLFSMEKSSLKKIVITDLLETKWNRIKRVGIIPSQESNNLLESNLKFVSHMQAHRIMEYFQYPRERQDQTGRKGIVRFLEFNLGEHSIDFEYAEKNVSNTCIINNENIMRCRYKKVEDGGLIVMDIYNYYEIES
jgi:hypothetical protein